MSETFTALIIGGSGEAGQSAVQRYCASAGKTPGIIATTSRAKDVPGAHRTFLIIDLTQAEAVKPVVDELRESKIHLIVYTPHGQGRPGERLV